MYQSDNYFGIKRYIFAHRWVLFWRIAGILILLLMSIFAARRGWWGITLLGLLMALLYTYFIVAVLWSVHRLEADPDYLRLLEMSRLTPEEDLLILDVGMRSAPIHLHRHLRQGRVTVIDIYNPQLMPDPALARYRATAPTPPVDPRLRWRDGSLDLLSLPNNSVKTIFLPRVLRQIAQQGDRERLLHEVHRVLEPGGNLLISEWVRTPTSWLVLGSGAARLPAEAYWGQLLQQIGFSLKLSLRHYDLIACYRANKRTLAEIHQMRFEFTE